jgi:predicted flavoprotein YhiN
MTIHLTDWHEIQSGIEFCTYNENDKLSEQLMTELKRRGIEVHTRSRLFIITDKVTKDILLDCLKVLNRTEVNIILN